LGVGTIVAGRDKVFPLSASIDIERQAAAALFEKIADTLGSVVACFVEQIHSFIVKNPGNGGEQLFLVRLDEAREEVDRTVR
jgi:hypothetical protein